jgi:hypothetical protein
VIAVCFGPRGYIDVHARMLQEKPDFANVHRPGSMVQCTFPEALYKVDVNLSTDKELEKVFLNFQVYMSKGIDLLAL